MPLPLVRAIGECDFTGELQLWSRRDVEPVVSEVHGLSAVEPTPDKNPPVPGLVMISRHRIDDARCEATLRVKRGPARTSAPMASGDRQAEPNGLTPGRVENLTRYENRQSPGPVVVVEEQHQSWLPSQGALTTISRLVVRSEAPGEVALRLPPMCSILEVQLNEQPLQPVRSADGRPAVRVSGATRPHELLVAWTWPLPPLGDSPSLTQVKLPRLAEKAADGPPNTWTVYLPANVTLVSSSPAASGQSPVQPLRLAPFAGMATGAQVLVDAGSAHHFVFGGDSVTLSLRPAQRRTVFSGDWFQGSLVGTIGMCVFLCLASPRRATFTLPLLLVGLGLFWCWRLRPEPVGPALLFAAVLFALAGLVRRQQPLAP
jgi:hypothetical protein